MSKAEFYRDELVPEVEERVIAGESAESAMMLVIFEEEDVDGAVLKHWVLKKHSSEGALEEWAARQRQAIQNSASKYAELKQIIHATPLERLDRAIIPQFTDWHKWIQRNAWKDSEQKKEALAFAKNEIWQRRAAAIAFQGKAVAQD